jgi:hypothetical protein
LASVAGGKHDDALAELHALFDKNLVPMVVGSQQAITEACLDRRLGLVLSCIDSGSTLEAVLEASSLEMLEGLGALCELLDRELVVLR